MMSRRRALLIRSALNSAPKPYDVRVITSLVIHESSSENGYTPWYTGDTYEFNESSSLFTLTDGSMYPLRYSTASAFDTQFVGNYCIKNAATGIEMYYFDTGCTATAEYDSSTGIYSITAHGRMVEYTPSVVPFAFTYSGDYVDERDANGKGDVTLNASGDFIVTEGTRKVTVYILGAGGGGAYNSRTNYGSASGGSGGYQTVEVELTPGTYNIVIGTGGTGIYTGASGSLTAGNGGNTVAFGYTSTGGSGGRAGYPGITASPYGGPGGSPNGNSGTTANPSATLSGGSPNGGNSTTNATANKGGDGLVRITFS